MNLDSTAAVIAQHLSTQSDREKPAGVETPQQSPRQMTARPLLELHLSARLFSLEFFSRFQLKTSPLIGYIKTVMFKSSSTKK